MSDQDTVGAGTWYVALDQKLAHLLEWDAPGHWVGTRCGQKTFWPWFVARPTERRCAACRRLVTTVSGPASPPDESPGAQRGVFLGPNGTEW